MAADAIGSIDPGAAGLGRITYTTPDGTFTFGAFRQYACDARPVMSDDRRSLKYMEASLTVRFVMQDAVLETQQTNMTQAEKILNTPGGNLVIEDIGLRDAISTQVGGNLPDVFTGVESKGLRRAPIGSQLAWECVWECTWRYSNCSDNLRYHKLLDFASAADYVRDERGFTTRTISATLEVARERNASGEFTKLDLDRYARRINIDIPPGMRRMSDQTRFNEAKNRIERTVVDKEIDHFPYPNGFTFASLTESFENIPPGFQQFMVTLNGRFRVAKGVNPGRAALWFLGHAVQVAGRLLENARGRGLGDTAKVVPVKLSLSHDKFTYETTGSATLVVSAALIKDILGASTMYDPVPETSYESWIGSLYEHGVGDEGGVSKYRFSDSDTKRIGLCVGKDTSPPTIGSDRHQFMDPITTKESIQLLCEGITEENSYIVYRNRLEYHQNENVQVHHKAKKWKGVDTARSAALAGGGVIAMLNPVLAPGVVAGAAAALSSRSANDLQYQGEGDAYVVLSGAATRIGHQPQVPYLKKLPGDVPFTFVNKNISEVEVVADMFGCPIYTVKWAIAYYVHGYVPSLAAPGNKKTLNHEDTVIELEDI